LFEGIAEYFNQYKDGDPKIKEIYDNIQAENMKEIEG
jgi:hypothetical protein